jgi:hypothetical protein
VTKLVIAEIRESQALGAHWTAWREFHDTDERLGAMLCGRCRAPSVFVSYATFMPARVTACAVHLPRNA